ncbi:MAG: CsgG/HfaB family protein, partial [Candidatus Marinimicrobia bacterium]|nr:CsgG/HfaB family protein [Candidatus Neomarinimicrobiota bacterium]
LSSCSTYYGKYEYNQYFQNNEPFITVDSEEEAAGFIARKLARRFKRSGYKTIAVLNFTDEYGDRINRGDFFAGMIVSGLTRYRNPIVVERASLYEIVKERELSQTNLIDNKGYKIQQLVQADYILHGRILRGKHDDMISVRCFEVGTGKVVYATTVSIDYTPDPPYVSSPPPVIIVTPPSGGTVKIDPPTSTPDEDKKEPVTKPKTKPSDGTESKGKIDLGNSKKPTTDQYQYKKKPVTTPLVKKPTTVNTKTSVTVKDAAVKKAVPVKKEVIKYKKPIEEEKEEKSKESSTTSTKKTTSEKKSTTVKK